MSEKKKTNPLVICADIAATGYMIYVVGLVVWAIIHSQPDNGMIPWQLDLYLNNIFPFVLASGWLLHRYSSEWYIKHPFLVKILNNRKVLVCIDLIAIIFFGYVFYVLIWAFQDTSPIGAKRPIQLILAGADIIPAAYSGFWFCYRYVTSWRDKYPFLIKFVEGNRYHWVLPTTIMVMVMIKAYLVGK